MATKSADLNAGVAYYGAQPPAADVPAIKAPLLLHYAGLDERINAGIEAYKKALQDGGKTFEIFIYDGVNHAFTMIVLRPAMTRLLRIWSGAVRPHFSRSICLHELSIARFRRRAIAPMRCIKFLYNNSFMYMFSRCKVKIWQ